jgi:hypothetical protein
MITIYPGADAPVSPLAAIAFVFGVLLLTMGACHLWLPRRSITDPPDWWGRLEDPVPEPSPAPVLAGVSGGGAWPNPLSAFGGDDPGPADPAYGSPKNPGSGVTYHGAVLVEGVTGGYWSLVDECDHEHATQLDALACAGRENPRRAQRHGRVGLMAVRLDP